MEKKNYEQMVRELLAFVRKGYAHYSGYNSSPNYERAAGHCQGYSWLMDMIQDTLADDFLAGAETDYERLWINACVWLGKQAVENPKVVDFANMIGKVERIADDHEKQARGEEKITFEEHEYAKMLMKLVEKIEQDLEEKQVIFDTKNEKQRAIVFAEIYEGQQVIVDTNDFNDFPEHEYHALIGYMKGCEEIVEDIKRWLGDGESLSELWTHLYEWALQFAGVVGLKFKPEIIGPKMEMILGHFEQAKLQPQEVEAGQPDFSDDLLTK